MGCGDAPQGAQDQAPGAGTFGEDTSLEGWRGLLAVALLCLLLAFWTSSSLGAMGSSPRTRGVLWALESPGGGMGWGIGREGSKLFQPSSGACSWGALKEIFGLFCGRLIHVNHSTSTRRDWAASGFCRALQHPRSMLVKDAKSTP